MKSYCKKIFVRIEHRNFTVEEEFVKTLGVINMTKIL